MQRLNKVYLHLGSNIGDRKQMLSQAQALIEKNIGKIKKTSSLYETEAWGNTEQDDFINQALLVETNLNPREVLSKILTIESQLGRIRKPEAKWHPRTIDIDIIFYNNLIIKEKDLILPHPRMHERNFVLIPMMEIADDVMHPEMQKSVEDLYLDSRDNLEVVMLE